MLAEWRGRNNLSLCMPRQKSRATKGEGNRKVLLKGLLPAPEGESGCGSWVPYRGLEEKERGGEETGEGERQDGGGENRERRGERKAEERGGKEERGG